MTILVTGAAGFIGSHLCELLLKKGSVVVGLDNMNAFYDPEVKQKNLFAIQKRADEVGGEFVFYATDIRHEERVRQILREHKVPSIIHLAAMAGVRPSLENPILYAQVNEVGTMTLLEEARRAGVQTFIFGSSSSVYGNNTKVPFRESDPVDHPISPYAATKKAGELMCHIYHRLYGMTVACLRFFTVYGPRQRPDLAINKFTHLIRQGRKVPIFGDGTKSRDFTYIDDIIDGVYKTLLFCAETTVPRYDIFNLGGSETTDVNTLVDLISRAMKMPASKQYLPDQPGDVDRTYADITKAKEVLGYEPKVKIEDGIARYVDWVMHDG